MNYQEIGTQLQAIVENARLVVGSDVAIPTMERSTFVSSVARIGRMDSANHGAMTILVHAQNGSVIVFYANDMVLRLDESGALAHYRSGAWELDLTFLADWVRDARRAQSQPQRCGFHAAIRRFFAIAQDMELDTTADVAIRWAMSVYFERFIASRRELTGAQWWEAAEAVRRRELVW